MADINLDFLSPEKREFLRRRAERRGSTVEEELDRALGEAMAAEEEANETAEDDEEHDRPRRPIDELESSHTPETLAEARRRDRELTRRMKEMVGGEPTTLMSIAGVIEDESPITGRNFHEYLYGECEDDD